MANQKPLFKAPYDIKDVSALFVIVAFILIIAAMVGNNLVTDLIGIGVGHLYYFFEDVYPIVAEIRGWRIKRWLEAPDFLKSLCGEYRNNINVAAEMAAAALLGEADDENDNNVVNNNQVVPNEE